MTAPGIAAVVLAAGSSTRMEGAHKLLEPVGGRPLVAWPVDAVLRAGADPVIVVTGHRADEVERVLPAGVTVVRNAEHRLGLSSSLRAGLSALPVGVAAALVALGDMPGVRARHCLALVGRWRPGAIAVPTRSGRRGHPVLWSERYFDEMRALQGDRGARTLMEVHAAHVVEVPMEDDGVLVDVDRPADLERARRDG